MPLTAPDWLTRRGGSVRPGIDGRSWFIFFAGEPQYEVTPVPAVGKFAGEVRQTISGKRFDVKGPFPTADEAIHGGLEELRKSLGW